MSIQVGAVLDGLIKLEAIVLDGVEVIHILHDNAFSIGSRLPLQLHVRLLSVGQLGLHDIA